MKISALLFVGLMLTAGSVTAQEPEIAVEQPELTDLPTGGTQPFGTVPLGSPVAISFTIRNSGSADLTGLEVTKEAGPDSDQFNITQQPAPSVIPGGTASFTVQFSPTTAGAKTALLHIASNDANENPFSITVTGTALSFTQDTDADGLNDASEFQMAALGFDWQVPQTALVNTLYANAHQAGLYKPAQVQALRAATPLISQNPETGKITLAMFWKKSANLTDYTAFPAQPAEVSVNGQGNIEFEFSVPDAAAFFRIETE
jgi:trimeric autotransporter adhesin